MEFKDDIQIFDDDEKMINPMNDEISQTYSLQKIEQSVDSEPDIPIIED